MSEMIKIDHLELAFKALTNTGMKNIIMSQNFVLPIFAKAEDLVLVLNDKEFSLCEKEEIKI